jgi:hypothetical protein
MNGYDVLPKIGSDNTIIKNPKAAGSAKSGGNVILKKPPTVALPQVKEKVDVDDDAQDVASKKLTKNADKLPLNKETRKYPLTVGAGVFDGMPTVYLFSDQDHIAKFQQDFKHIPWAQYPSFVYRHIRTWQGLKNMLAALDSNFTFNPRFAEFLLNAGKKLYRKGTPQLIQRNAIELNFRTFTTTSNHSPNRDPNSIKVFPMLIDGQLYAAASIPNQPKQAQKFKRMAVQGCGPAQQHEALTMIAFKAPTGAIKFLTTLSQKYKIAGLNDAVDAMRKVTPNWMKL